MTVEQFGVAIRAAYEKGYLDGLYHPKERRVIERMRECSAGFWTYVLTGMRARMRPGAAAVDPASNASGFVVHPVSTDTASTSPVSRLSARTGGLEAELASQVNVRGFHAARYARLAEAVGVDPRYPADATVDAAVAVAARLHEAERDTARLNHVVDMATVWYGDGFLHDNSDRLREAIDESIREQEDGRA